MNAPSDLSRIHNQIMWNRLHAVVEEQAQTMVRTAFSTTVRESGDLSAGVFDLKGRMLAQAVTGTPGHINSMAESVVHFLEEFPVSEMHEGDHYITNDPWKGTGHLHDLTVVSPTFRNGECVAIFANTAHVIDIGGRGFSCEGRQVYEEGLFIPIMPVVRDGQLNDMLFRFVRANCRTAVETEGDIYSLCACNDVGSQRLVEMMDEFGLDDIQPLADYIIDTSREATLEEIRKLPKGTLHNTVQMDGYEFPVTLQLALTVADDGIDLDYTGSSPCSGYGINVPMSYCRAYSCFGLKVIVAPDIPNNHGSLEPFRIDAPDGSILNAKHPWPVAGRHLIGQMLPDTIFGCLAQIMPEKVPAEGASSLWNAQLRGGPSTVGAEAGDNAPMTPDFDIIIFNSGGTGARTGSDGLNGTAFPSGVRTMPTEASENFAPIVVWRKEFWTDSGGAGRYRGGCGQVMHIGAHEDAPFALLAMFDRCEYPARGRAGGLNGQAGKVGLVDAGDVGWRGKGRYVIPNGDALRLNMTGGAGFGDPLEREAERVARDVKGGYVSRESAHDDYGVVLDDACTVDAAATEARRAELRAARS